MFYLTRILGRPVTDASGTVIGTIKDLAIATGEIFPRITALAFVGPDKTPFMLSWRKFVADFDDDGARLTVSAPDLRFSLLQPDEVLLARDLLSKQIVDTQGMKVVRVNDLKLSESRNQLRLLGAEVGARGILRGLWPPLETAAEKIMKLLGASLPEDIIAWNYMDLLERDLSHVQLSVTHKRLHELHPADVADVLEQLSASQRARVFEHLDNDQAAEAISELEDELQADVLDDLTDERASDILEIMDPDDAADILGDLPYDKAETLLRLMGVHEQGQVRKLLGYRENTAGGIMTPDTITVTEDMTVQQVVELLRTSVDEADEIYSIFVVGEGRVLEGVVPLRNLILATPDTKISDILSTELFSAGPEDDQEQVAEMISKYDLLSLPVVDEAGILLGMVTVDDALDVMEQEAAEDLELATGFAQGAGGAWLSLRRTGSWAVAWSVLAFAIAAVFRNTGAPSRALMPVFVAAALLPIVLRLTEDLATRAAAGVIEGPTEEGRPRLRRRLVSDGLMGIALAVIAGLGVLAIVDVAVQDVGKAVLFAAPAALTVFLTTLAAALVADWAERASDAGRHVSQTLFSAALLVLAAVLFLSLVAAGTVFAAGAFPGLLG